ncbi:MAG: DAK2 domain-containing protein [Acetobacteraceae bacterium]|nr:DAK2 domain-containing protein [Acetobacteraceae bacterium]
MRVEELSGPCFRDMILAATELMREKRAEVDALNVYPVPDGDTGANMSLTLEAACRELAQARGTGLSTLAEAVSLGSLMGARGNSGVILSQLFRGFARGVDGREAVDPRGLARALQEGVATAYQAVMRPVEGTILTVAREAAQAAAEKARAGGDVAEVLDAALRQAEETLLRTPDMLAVLKRAGVVDAGGKGLCYVLYAAAQVAQGARPARAQAAAAAESRGPAFEMTQELTQLTYPYDAQFLVRGSGIALDALRDALTPLGDSLLVVGSPSLVKVHIHTSSPGRVLDQCLEYGDLDQVEILDMRQQQEEFRAAGQAGGTGAYTPSAVPPSAPAGASALGAAPAAPLAPSPAFHAAQAAADCPRTLGVVSVALGEGLAQIFASLGADEVVHGGQTMNPSIEDLLKAIDRVPYRQVLVLPNNGNVIPAAEQARTLTNKEVHVVPSRTIPQGIAALVAMRPQASLEANLAAMKRAMDGVRTGLVTFAVRSASVRGLAIEEGTILGLCDGEIKVSGRDRSQVAASLVESMMGEDTEVISLFYGADVQPGEAAVLAEELRRRLPGHEVELRYGGQPHYYYIIAVE